MMDDKKAMAFVRTVILSLKGWSPVLANLAEHYDSIGMANASLCISEAAARLYAEAGALWRGTAEELWKERVRADVKALLRQIEEGAKMLRELDPPR